MGETDERSEMDLPLAAPLGDPLLKRPQRARRIRHDPVVWCAAFMLAGLASVLGWVLLNGDPQGGRPTVHVAVQVDTSADGRDIALPERIDPDALNTAWASAALDLPRPGRERVLSLSDDLDPGLIEESVYGLLPRIASDGRTPSQVYARPTVRFAGRTRARVAIVLTGLGLSDTGTAQTIEAMPGAVTLAFVPYPRGAAAWAGKARRDGHETLLQVPQEPFGYPDNDPGPRALLTHLPDEENVERLRWALGRMQGYVGVAPFMGARWALDEEAVAPMLSELKARGLVYVDGGMPGSKIPLVAGRHGVSAAAGQVRLTPGSPADIDAQIAALEQVALVEGQAVGIAQAHPDIVARIAAWTPTLEERGLALVPVSSVVSRGG